MSITVVQRDNKPEEWRALMGSMEDAQKAGPGRYSSDFTRCDYRQQATL